MFTGIDSFPLLAVPFFILAAELMTGGKLTVVLLRLPLNSSDIGAADLVTPTCCP